MVRALTFMLSFILVNSAFAATLFEGYYKVLANDKHAGYSIIRYSFDDKKQQFQSVYFLKTNAEAGEMTESLKAVADANLNPISYEYTNVMGKSTKIIDAKFKKGMINATVKQNGKISRINKKIEDGTFLSTFLTYIILKGKDGLKENTNYQYLAIAEEDGEALKGLAVTAKPENYKGLTAFKIQNTYKDATFTSWVTARGEVLGTEAAAAGLRTELVANPGEATQGQLVSQAIIKTLFGEIPAGIGNPIAAQKPAVPSKQSGVPAGSGVQLKTESPKGSQ